METTIRKRALVVEDDAQMAYALTKRLEHANYEVTSTRSGKGAVHYAECLKPAIITMDVRLPDMDGLTVAWELSRDPQTAKIPIIFITGMADPHITDKFDPDGDHYFIHKPYDPALLIRLVNSLLARDDLSEMRRISHAKRRQPINGTDRGSFLSDFGA